MNSYTSDIIIFGKYKVATLIATTTSYINYLRVSPSKTNLSLIRAAITYYQYQFIKKYLSYYLPI